MPGTSPFHGNLSPSRILEDPPDYSCSEHLARTTFHISPPSLCRDLTGIAALGDEMDRKRDIFLPSISLGQQESTLAHYTSLENGESVIPVEAQSPRQGPVKRAEDGGIRIAGGPPGRQVHDLGGSRRGSEVASSTGSTLPPAYELRFD